MAHSDEFVKALMQRIKHLEEHNREIRAYSEKRAKRDKMLVNILGLIYLVVLIYLYVVHDCKN